MICKDCGAELPKGGFYCGGCGRPVGFDGPVTLTSEEPGLDDVPEPTTSREPPAGLGPIDPNHPRSTVTGKALCSMCMGAFPETVMSIVDGRPFCPDCAPLSGRRREPEVQSGVATPGEPEPMLRAPASTPTMSFQEERMGGGGLRGLFAVLVLVLLGGAGFAAFTMIGSDRIDALMKGVDTSRTDARLLIQKYDAGEEIYYEAKLKAGVQVDMSGSGLAMFGADNVDVDATVFGGMRINVLKVDDRGNSNLRVTFENFDIDAEFLMNGKPAPFPMGSQMDPFNGLNGQSFEMRVDPFGDALGPPTGLSGRGPMDAASMDEFFNGMLSGVPRHEVRVGDTWSASNSLPMTPGGGFPGGAGEMSFVVNYRVEGYKRLAGRDCMVISLEGGLDGPNSGLSVGGVGSAEVDMKLKGVVFFDAEAGRMVKAAVDVDADLGMSGPGMSLDMDMDMELDIDMR